MSRQVVLAVLCVSLALPAAAGADPDQGGGGAEAPIEGRWEGHGGAIEVTPSGPNAWVGTVVKETNLAGCPGRVGTVPWQIGPGLDDRSYTGTHVWVDALNCEPIGTGPATFKVDYVRDHDSADNGAPQLELCTTDPNNEHSEYCLLFNQVVDELLVKDGESCVVRQNQRRKVSFSARRLLIHWAPPGPIGTPPHELRHELEKFAIGKIRIRAATCRKRSGRWGIISPVDVDLSSVGLDPDGKPRKRGHRLAEGWGIGIRASSLGSLEVQVAQCKEGWFWQTLGKLNDIPVPGLKYGVEVVKYLAGKMLPDDKVKCVDWGVQELELRVHGRGRLVVQTGFDSTREALHVWQSADTSTYYEKIEPADPAIRTIGR